jgi:hypothetical protein
MNRLESSHKKAENLHTRENAVVAFPGSSFLGAVWRVKAVKVGILRDALVGAWVATSAIVFIQARLLRTFFPTFQGLWKWSEDNPR